MSRHSHWAKIKRGKGAADVKRGMIFTKLARSITVAARAKGPDPNFNFKLRLAIDQARAANMPKDNIDRAIVRATGEGAAVALEELLYEGMLPGGIGIIIESTSDNKNRATGEVKKLLAEYGGNLAASGAVKWNFDKRGVIHLSKEQPISKEELELKLIDAGAEDIKTTPRYSERREDSRPSRHSESRIRAPKENKFPTGQASSVRDKLREESQEEIIVYTQPEKLEQVKTALEKDNIKIDFAGLEWIAKDKVSPDAEARVKLEKLFESLDESEEVDEYYTNLS